MIAKYIYNKEICGLKKNHKYELKIKKPLRSYVYDCVVVSDLTDDETLDLYLQFASETSIKNYFNIERLELED